MKQSNNLEEQPTEASDLAVETAVTFLGALFAESDTILFRPIETWVESGRKRSRVDFKNTYYWPAKGENLRLLLLSHFAMAARNRLNLFIGVCPRRGGNGRYDLAWQIRTVRALWADIDHISVEEALDRIARSKLPEPSIVVNSGNGVHIYWLLDEPYVIDDAGDPPPVEIEWVETPDGRSMPRKYIKEDGERVYLEQRSHATRLSPKAMHIQDVLAGVAQACGGDHTIDLSRLLRLPGTYNRKDERNGKEPIPTVLVTCDPTKRYPLSVFEPLAKPAPETERAKHIAAMPLPRIRKATAAKSDKLAELIAASAIAAVGGRSEADFNICCFAIRNGIDKEEVWPQVEAVGKFSEQGRRYFDLTWESAEGEVRGEVFAKMQKGDSPKRKRHPSRNGSPDFEVDSSSGPDDRCNPTIPGRDDHPPVRAFAGPPGPGKICPSPNRSYAITKPALASHSSTMLTSWN